MEKKKISCKYSVLVIILFAALAFVVDYAIIDRNLNSCHESGDVDSGTSVYQKFSNKLKDELSKYDSNNMQYQYINSDIVGGYIVYLNENGSLFIKYSREELNSKYGDYKIADNVLSFYVIYEGNGGGSTLYFINNDGTVGSASVEYGANESIEVKEDLGYKNIVSVITGGFGMEYSGAYGPIFIDIDGNLISSNLK